MQFQISAPRQAVSVATEDAQQDLSMFKMPSSLAPMDHDLVMGDQAFNQLLQKSAVDSVEAPEVQHFASTKSMSSFTSV